MSDLEKILFVDLDKSLVKSDLLLESFLNYFSRNFFAPLISLLILIREGKVGLKRYLTQNSTISVSNLPYNKKVIEFIKKRKKNRNYKIILISASDEDKVSEIANYLGLFDASYGSKSINLKSTNKLKKIQDIAETKPFEYLGDSYDDLAIWQYATNCILINPPNRLINKVRDINSSIEVIYDKKRFLQEALSSMRVYQWVKNFLIFIPAILTFQPLQISTLQMLKGYLAFSLIASAFYIFNDLLDIENDRNHDSKKNRPFASGDLSVTSGSLIFILLIISSCLMAMDLPVLFQYCLGLYAISTYLYSQFFKRIPVLDIFTLSYLYLLRLISGGALISMSLSNWLLTFSVFFFLFLAAIKRWIEIQKMNLDSISGRGYLVSDKGFVSQLSYFSGLISVLVICFYIESRQAELIYNSSQLLWFIPLVLLYWVLETLFKVERNYVNDDPVKYALQSKTSYIAVISFALILYFAQN